MNTRDTTADLQNILEQQLSIDVGLNTEADVIRYVNRIVESLDEVGYLLPEEFEIGTLLKAIDEEILSSTAVLDEDTWGGAEASQKKQSFLSRAVGAVKGAVQRGVTSAQTKLRRYHSAQADTAMDKAVDPKLSAQDSHKAAKQYAKHYVKATALNKKLNPGTHASLSKEKAADFGVEHGSAKDARLNVYHARKMVPVIHAIKARAPAQKAAKVADRAAASAKTQGTSSGGLTRSERPTISTQADTKVQRIVPKGV
jgi:hypothetical protein